MKVRYSNEIKLNFIIFQTQTHTRRQWWRYVFTFSVHAFFQTHLEPAVFTVVTIFGSYLTILHHFTLVNSLVQYAPLEKALAALTGMNTIVYAVRLIAANQADDASAGCTAGNTKHAISFSGNNCLVVTDVLQEVIDLTLPPQPSKYNYLYGVGPSSSRSSASSSKVKTNLLTCSFETSLVFLG